MGKIVNIVEIKKKDLVRPVVEEFLKEIDDVEVVMILALCKDGTQRVRCSMANMEQKSLLFTFFQAWIVSWFRLS